jgi:hypothetical protein
MLINFTNHPSENWSNAQIAVASVYGGIRDVPFPNVDPNGDEDYIKELADSFVSQIISLKPTAVLCQGEMTLAFAVASILASEYGVIVLAACSERMAGETVGNNGETVKKAEFSFTRFRKYLS